MKTSTPPSSSQTTWGVDIGGAHLKLCRPDGRCTALPFPMWTDHNRLGQAVVSMIHQLSNQADTPHHAWNDRSTLTITMTGELADCFETRTVGVTQILEQIADHFPEPQCKVYAVGGRWFDLAQAKHHAWQVAASNWHALAEWILAQPQWNPLECDAIVDVGSTTVDIIPTKNGIIQTSAQTDRQRMELGQLVYTGMERTPIHAIVRTLRLDGHRCPVMAERFATILDANLILGAIDEQPDNLETADGRARTRACALGRLARMVGEDGQTLSECQNVSLAQQVVDAQARQVRRALRRSLPQSNPHSEINDPKSVIAKHRYPRVLVSGHGRALVERLRQHPSLNGVEFVYLDDFLDPMAARCAPAVAVAWLWQHRQTGNHQSVSTP